MKNKLGFGFLRLPMAGEEVDYAVLNPMVDTFLSLGGRYFDTAYTYLDGKSEEALRRCLTSRYPRDAYLLADKLPGWKLDRYEACMPCFLESCTRCGVDFFDVYMLHWLNERNYAIAEKTDQFRFLRELKAAGKAKRIGFSYHDGPELLDRILMEYPEVDIIQLQLNYLDWESPTIQAHRCYEVAEKHGKAVVVMEPVKGGTLARLPAEAEQLLRSREPGVSPAVWALRFAAGLSQVETVLSGMNAMEQLLENMRPFPPLHIREEKALFQAADMIRRQTAVGCTGCGYCLAHCPVKIPIPQYFALYNEYARDPGEGWKMEHTYQALKGSADLSGCVSCHACAEHCPQHLDIPGCFPEILKAFE